MFFSNYTILGNLKKVLRNTKEIVLINYLFFKLQEEIQRKGIPKRCSIH